MLATSHACRAAAAALAVSLPALLPAQTFDVLERSNTGDFTGASADNAILIDADGNGTIDILQRKGSWLRNDGDLVFPWFPGGTSIPTSLPSGVWSTYEVAGDVDRDGHVDLVRARGSLFPAGHDVAVHLGLGGGNWGPITAASPFSTGSVAGAQELADFDGDLFPDLLVFLHYTQQLTFYRNQQNGQFVDLGPLPLAAYHGFRAVGDLDGDGDLDLVCEAGGMLQMLANNGTGAFAPVAGTGLPAMPDLLSLQLADADADGDLDLLVVVAETMPPQLWTNVGGAFVATPTTLPNAGTGWAFADLDQDQRAEVLLMEAPGNAPLRMHCLRGTATGFVPTSVTTIDEWFALGSPAVADLDADGDGDAVLGGTLVLLNDGALGFALLARKPFEIAADSSTVCAADLDGDDVPEVLAGRSIHQNGGDGWFALVSTPVPAGRVVQATADFDLDGDQDAVWTARNGPAGSWGLLRNQAGTMVAQPVAGATTWGRVVVDDFDGDGYPDLATESGALLRNLGGTGFASVGTLPAATRAVAAADFDGDGDPDLVVAGAAGWNIYVNSGFVFQPLGASGPEQLLCASARDLDGDSDVDLAALCQLPVGTDLVLWNNVGGSLQQVAAFYDGSSPLGMAADDVDGDGDIDLATGCYWKNVGGWTFALVETLLAGAPCLFDADLDGDLDIAHPTLPLFAAFPQRAWLLVNRQRQLHAPQLPVLGHPYTIEMSCMVTPGGGDLVAPALATSRIAPFAIPGIGTLQVDPATTVLGPIAATAPDGRHSFSFPLPANPALAGIEVYWQGIALTPSSLRLTNMLRDRLLP
jgi:hypothetical protein